jgi:hypothetical protein
MKCAVTACRRSAYRQHERPSRHYRHDPGERNQPRVKIGDRHQLGAVKAVPDEYALPKEMTARQFSDTSAPCSGSTERRANVASRSWSSCSAWLPSPTGGLALSPRG